MARAGLGPAAAAAVRERQPRACKAVTVGGQAEVFPPGNAVDGNANTYWESANNAFPQSLTVDLGSAASINKVTLKLPPSSAWGARTETATISGSTDGGSYTTLVGSRGYASTRLPATRRRPPSRRRPSGSCG